MNRYNLAKVQIDFRNPFPRIAHDGTRIGKVADARRASKLPSEAALDAIAQVANLAKDPADILRIRIIELLACGGWRVNELLTVRADCEVTEAVFTNGAPLLNADGSAVERYGISDFGEKGAGPRIKWIPTPMVDVAKRAVSDIKRITSDARETARWMELNPGRAKLPAGWQHHDSFSFEDISKMLGLADRGSAAAWVRTNLISISMSGSRAHVDRPELEAAIIGRQGSLPRSDVPLKKAEYLFLMPQNWSHATRATIECVVDFVTDGRVADFIMGREGVRTIFERLELTEADGSSINITSHQFRHWLNTLAQQGGMSQMEIARWSGRKDVGQNSEYDHMSGVELAEKARELLSKGKVHSPAAKIHERLTPARRATFREAQFTTAHTTDLGMCANDWSLSPCMEHGACAGCEQHLVIKGNLKQKARALLTLQEHQTLLESAEAEAEEGTYGASNYVSHHRRTRDALVEIMRIHSDANIPDGELVQLQTQKAKASLSLMENVDEIG